MYTFQRLTQGLPTPGPRASQAPAASVSLN
jgi:hypothetical protein